MSVSNIEVSRLKKHEHLAPHLALLCVQFLFGTWPIFGKFILRVLPSTGIAALRICGAALLLILLRQFRTSVHIEDKRDYAKLFLFSLLGIVFNQLLFMKGLQLTTVVNASIISATIPIFALIVGLFMGNDSLSLLKVVGIILAVLGVIYLLDPAKADFSGGYALGNILLLLNTFCFGSYIAISKNVISRVGTFTSMFWIFIFGGLVTLPLAFYSLDANSITQTPLNIWLALLYVIIFPTICSYFLNAWALARVAPSVVAVYIYLQPLIAFALAPFFLGEKWNSRAWVAMILIFSGLFFVTRQKKQIDIHTTMP